MYFLNTMSGTCKQENKDIQVNSAFVPPRMGTDPNKVRNIKKCINIVMCSFSVILVCTFQNP